jgi:RNA polymerase sigma-70 factor (ECF subfamily)
VKASGATGHGTFGAAAVFFMTIVPDRPQAPDVVNVAQATSRGSHDSDRHARLRVVFHRDFDYVWNSLRRLGVHTRDREDLVQEVFVRVYRHLDEYDWSRPSRPWLFAFAFRCASDWRRSAWQRVEPMADYPEPEASAPGADEALARKQDRAMVERALQQVPLERRGVFILHEIEDCAMQQIADLLGIPLFTAYSRLRVARKEFATAVKRLLARRGKR